MSIYLVKEVVETFAPSENAENWDNTGILIDSKYTSSEQKIMLTIDFTSEVEEECRINGIHTVVAYHPVIFKSLEKIDADKYVKCIQDKISVYSPHTQLDFLMNSYVKNLLPEYVTIEDTVKILKKECGLEKVRIVCNHRKNKYHKHTNVFVGVGAAYKNPEFKDALLITGEMSHHDMLKCKENNTEVVLLEHSNSERIFLKELRNLLLKDPRLSNYDILISTKDKDPVELL